MDVAMTSSGPITIEKLRTLDAVPEMWCPGETMQGVPCEGRAWSASMDSKVQAAHFRATHIPGCLDHPHSAGSRIGDQGHTHVVAARENAWKIRLSAVVRQDISENGRWRPDPQNPGTRTRILSVTDQLARSEHPECSLHRLLVDLVAGTCPPDMRLQVEYQKPVPLADLVVKIDETRQSDWNGQRRIVWGKIREYKLTRYGGNMLKLENAGDQLAILLPQKTLERMKETEPKKLVGRYVIAYGQFPSPPVSDWPYVKVEAKEHIDFMPRRRHRSV
ncbi:hypothetical protein ACLQ8T_16390 (plasmid) [Glutamicibacter sp. FR1]|uniref:hypothetical protein n=1 Tax=Glutamicibacter sp. FR1 TaxID=3393744 RepID=UPI0039AED8DC